MYTYIFNKIHLYGCASISVSVYQYIILKNAPTEKNYAKGGNCDPRLHNV